MPESADITSVEAIAQFRTALLLYVDKVRPLLDDAGDEVHRTREWLRVTQRLHWENRVRTLRRDLSDAQQALFSAELSKLREPSSAETAAVHQARRAFNAAEEHLDHVKRAAGLFEKEAQPRLKQVEQLRSIVANDLPNAARFLERIITTLDRYAVDAAASPKEAVP
jgi:hypothetical protein